MKFKFEGCVCYFVNSYSVLIIFPAVPIQSLDSCDLLFCGLMISFVLAVLRTQAVDGIRHLFSFQKFSIP